MYLLMDMGTSSTRLWLCDGDEEIAYVNDRFGAGYRKKNGAADFFEKTNSLIDKILSSASLKRGEIECMIVSGMGTSEIGISEIPHIELPVDKYTLARSVVETRIHEIPDLNLLCVPGVKQTKGEELDDIMRGEETEIFGILDFIGEKRSCTIVLPGTHNKVVKINEKGKIESFRTAMSGECIDLIVKNSILSGSVTHNFEIVRNYVLLGADDASKNGLTNTLFKIRVMSKNGIDIDSLSSYLYGAVLSQDIPNIISIANGDRIYIGGNRNFRRVLTVLLRNEKVIELSDEISANATMRGLAGIYSIYGRYTSRSEIIKTVESEKLIAIIRNPNLETLFDAVDALYEGGVRLIEVTFDRSGKISSEKTAEIINSLCKKYRGKIHIGAGTVTSIKEVDLACRAGAKYIISPNVDKDIISYTRNIGLVSIPGAYTPTEIAAAKDAGADFIKLFPADGVSFKYVKAVKSPLSDVKLIAVGGVDPCNAKSFLDNGYSGVGVGSNLYDQRLVETGEFSSLTARAKAYVDALNS